MNASKRCRTPGAFLIFLALVLSVPSLAAQETAATRVTLRGRVTDGAGAPLASVRVVASAVERTAHSGADGFYVLPGLPRRTLELSFERLGYATRVVAVDLGGRAAGPLDVVLDVRPLESEALVVTGSPTATDPLTSPLDLSPISQERLRQVRSASLGNVVRDAVPGATSIMTGPQVGKPVLRGLSGTRIRILQNGIGQDYFPYGIRHAPQTNLSEAERVEVARGPASVLYGSSALGGAVNVLTRHLPRAEGGHGVLEGRLSTQLFSNNEEWAVLGEVAGAAGAFGYRAGLERRQGGDYRAPDGPTWFETNEPGDPKYTGRIPFTDFSQWSGYAQAGAAAGWGTAEVMLTRWSNENNFLLPAGGPSDSSENPPLGIGIRLGQTNLSARGNVVAGAWVLRPTLMWANVSREASPPGQTLSDEADPDVDLLTNMYTLRLEALHPELGASRRLRGTVGLEVMYQDTDSRGPEQLEPPSEIGNLALFAFEEWRSEPWTVAVGARLDLRRQEAPPNERTTDPDLLENEYAVLSGSLGASYEFLPGVAVAANLGTGFRAPSIFELYASGVHGGVAAIQLGTPTLNSERSISADLGLRLRTDRVGGEITAYQNWISNYIYLSNTGETGEGGLPIFVNDQTDARLTGVEGFLEVSIVPWLTVGAGGAWLDTNGDGLEDPDTGADGSLPLVPANRINGSVRVQPSAVGALVAPFAEFRVRHVLSKETAGLFEPFSQFDVIPFGTASTDDYTLIDLYLGGTFELGRTPVDVTIGLENLADETYRDFLDTYKGYALGQGRNLFLKAGVGF
jgi:iron complex outermembrane receptor protein/hemoglobin/transferrin/lactoferrin receptor protein